MSRAAPECLISDALAVWSASRDDTPAHYKRDDATRVGAGPAEFTSGIPPFDKLTPSAKEFGKRKSVVIITLDP